MKSKSRVVSKALSCGHEEFQDGSFYDLGRNSKCSRGTDWEKNQKSGILYTPALRWIAKDQCTGPSCSVS